MKVSVKNVKEKAAKKGVFVPVKGREARSGGELYYKVETMLGFNIIIPGGAKAEDLKVILTSLGIVT